MFFWCSGVHLLFCDFFNALYLPELDINRYNWIFILNSLVVQGGSACVQEESVTKNLSVVSEHRFRSHQLQDTKKMVLCIDYLAKDWTSESSFNGVFNSRVHHPAKETFEIKLAVHIMIEGFHCLSCGSLVEGFCDVILKHYFLLFIVVIEREKI